MLTGSNGRQGFAQVLETIWGNEKHQKSMPIPDFQRDDNIWVRSDEEKGRLYSIAISHKLIRTMSLKEETY